MALNEGFVDGCLKAKEMIYCETVSPASTMTVDNILWNSRNHTKPSVTMRSMTVQRQLVKQMGRYLEETPEPLPGLSNERTNTSIQLSGKRYSDQMP